MYISFKDMMILTISSKRSSHQIFSFRRCSKGILQAVSNTFKLRRSQTSIDQTPQKVITRGYALKLYSQYIPEGNFLSNSVLKYVKLKNSFDIDCNVHDVPNVFNKESAVKQLQALIIHSLEPTPEDVVKLFTIYTTCSRSFLYSVFNLPELRKVLMTKVETSILQMSLDQLHNFSVCLKALRDMKMKDMQELSLLTFEECLTRAELSSDSLKTCIQYFLVTMELFGNSVGRKNGYQRFMSVFEEHLGNAGPEELSQILYFTGLSKTPDMSDLPVKAVKLLSPHFDKLGFIDIGLITSSLFRLKLKFSKEAPMTYIAHKLSETLLDQNFELGPLDSFALVSAIKYIRLTMYKNKQVLHALKIFFENTDRNRINPQITSHTIALYANIGYYDSEMFSLLENQFLSFLNSSEDTIRIKDISRVMWSLSHMQHQCKTENLHAIIKCLEDFCATGDLLTHPTHVVDSVIALSSLNIFPEKLMTALLQPKVFKAIRGKKLSRYLSRLFVLDEIRKCSYPHISAPPLPEVSPTELPQRSISDECIHRPCVARLKNAVRWINKECGVTVFRIQFLVPHIHFCSVALTPEAISPPPRDTSEVGKRVFDSLDGLSNPRVAIDVNDENTSIMDEDGEGGLGSRPIGLEALKRTLLRRRGWEVKVLHAGDVMAAGEDEEGLAALILQTAIS